MTQFRILLLLIASFLLAPICSAQVRGGTVEINPFAGYLFGGRFPQGTLAIFDTKVDVDNHATYGARLGWNITSKVEIEGQVSRTETAFVTPGSGEVFSSSGQRLGDLTIDYLLGYGTFNFGHGRAVPYVTFGMGAARLDADICRGVVTIPEKPCVNPDRDTRFTASAGVGLKAFLTPHVGLRFDGRYYGTYLRDDSRRSGCDRRCDNRTDWLSNGDVTGGLIFAF
jgi:opacity protein-like surface antigen